MDLIGVGNYEAGKGRIEAEDYFEATGIVKKENQNGGFSIGDIDDGDYLIFPNIRDLENFTKIILHFKAIANGSIELREDSPQGKLLGTVKVKRGAGHSKVMFQASNQNLCLLFKGSNKDFMELDSFHFNALK